MLKFPGPTKVFKTRYEQPETIRGIYGLTDTRNSAHGSDSVSTAEEEIRFFFPEFNFSTFESEEKESFVNGEVTFDQSNFVHKILRQKKLKNDEEWNSYSMEIYWNTHT